MFSICRSQGWQCCSLMPRCVGSVCPAAVEERALPDQDEAGGHDRLEPSRVVVGGYFTWTEAVAARDDLGRTVLFREVVEGPYRADALGRSRAPRRLRLDGDGGRDGDPRGADSG